MTLDRRLFAYKDDVADFRLRGKVRSLRFVTPELRQISVSVAPVLREPRFDAPTESCKGVIGYFSFPHRIPEPVC